MRQDHPVRGARLVRRGQRVLKGPWVKKVSLDLPVPWARRVHKALLDPKASRVPRDQSGRKALLGRKARQVFKVLQDPPASRVRQAFKDRRVPKD